jgi:hypothetical protein
LREILAAEEIGWQPEKHGPLRAYEQEARLKPPNHDEKVAEFHQKQKKTVKEDCHCK